MKLNFIYLILLVFLVMLIVNNVILQDVVLNVNQDILLKMEFAWLTKLKNVTLKMKLHVLNAKMEIILKMVFVQSVFLIVYHVLEKINVINVLQLIFLMDSHVKDVELVVKNVLIQTFVSNVLMGIIYNYLVFIFQREFVKDVLMEYVNAQLKKQ